MGLCPACQKPLLSLVVAGAPITAPPSITAACVIVPVPFEKRKKAAATRAELHGLDGDFA